MDTIGLYILGFIVVCILIYGALTYNALVVRKNMVENQASQIDVELKRRFDLIPSLVEVVKGYSNYEKDTLEAVISARNKYLNANSTDGALQADSSLSSALSRLFSLVESYPDLKANTNFLNLQHELSNTEKKIAFARQFYNDAVYKLNTKVEKFPSNIFANLFKFSKAEFFEVSHDERENVKVEL